MSLRILMYSHDSGGLSHAWRVVTVASHLASTIENVSILILTDLPIAGKLAFPANVDYVHLPGIESFQTGFRARNLNLSLNSLIRLRKKIAQSAAKTFRPNLFVIEREPHTIPEEMIGILRYVAEKLPETKVAWCLPDVIGEPGKTSQAWQDAHITGMLEEFSHEVWIYGNRALWDHGQVYGLSETLVGRYHYLGYLPGPHRSSVTEPRDLDELHPELPTVLVTAGRDAGRNSLANCYLGFLESLDTTRLQSVILAGPLMPAAEKRSFKERARQLPNVIFHRFSKHFHHYLARASLVVTVGGYNTLSASLALHKRILLIPRNSELEEHRQRAKIFRRRGLIDVLEQPDLSDIILGEKVLQLLNSDRLNKNGSPLQETSFEGLSNLTDRVKAITGTLLKPEKENAPMGM